MAASQLVAAHHRIPEAATGQGKVGEPAGELPVVPVPGHLGEEILERVVGISLLPRRRLVHEQVPSAIPQDPLGDVAPPDVRQAARTGGRQIEERERGPEPARVLAVEGGPASRSQSDAPIPGEPDWTAPRQAPDGVHVRVVVTQPLADRAVDPPTRQALERRRRPLQLPPWKAPRPDIGIRRREVAVHVDPSVPFAGRRGDVGFARIPEARVGKVVVVGLQDRVGSAPHRQEVADVLPAVVAHGEPGGQPRRRLRLAGKVVVPALR